MHGIINYCDYLIDASMKDMTALHELFLDYGKYLFEQF